MGIPIKAKSGSGQTRRVVTAAAVVALVMALALPAGAGRGGSDRPFKASAEGAAAFVYGIDPCPLPFRVQTDYTATGEASHMGDVQIHGTHCPVLGGHTDGQLTIVADNGDELWAEYEHETGEPWFPITFTGGTGRFAGAAGDATLQFTVTQIFIPGCQPFQSPACFDLSVPWPATFTLSGQISY